MTAKHDLTPDQIHILREFAAAERISQGVVTVRGLRRDWWWVRGELHRKADLDALLDAGLLRKRGAPAPDQRVLSLTEAGRAVAAELEG